MQNFTPPGGWGPVLHFLHENRLALQGALTAFFIALLFSLWDGVAWRRSFTAGFICGFVALAVVSFFEQLGVSDMDWSFVIAAAGGGAVPQFDSGGYTEAGGKFEPKGIVQGGEFVFTKEATNAWF